MNHLPAPRIRAARMDDAAAINRIYNHYVHNTAITFDLEPWTIDRRREWLAGFIDDGDGDGNGDGNNNRHHVLVAELNGNLAGFAFNQAFRAKMAYRRATEVTVYAAPDAQARGVGRALYAALFNRIAATDLHRAYAVITLPNPRSIALHEHFGFTRIATLSEVGYKFDRYIDVAWFEKAL